jgi:DNA-directed RNA polymerase subunit A"
MTIYLQRSFNTREKAQQIATEIQEIKLNDTAVNPSINLVDMLIEVPLDQDKMRQRKLKIKYIIDVLQESLKTSKVSSRQNSIIIRPKEELSIKDLQKLKTKALDIHIKGIKNVSQVIVTQKDKEWIINTLGSNLAKILLIQGVDDSRTTTNNIHEITKVLGVEAGRNAIIREAMATLEDQGLNVDIRHIMLVADVMTADGRIKPIGRYGVAGAKGSVLARANFEETIKHLTNASLSHEIDKLESVVENVMINQVVPVGTGMFDVIFKPKK